MSKHPKPIRPGKSPAPTARPRSQSGIRFLLVAAAAVAAFGIWRWRTPPAPTPPPAVTPVVEVPTTNPPPSAVTVVAKPDFQKLKGKWLRPDGGYVIEVKSVTDGGTMDAGYFNPKPIHVARAEASLDGAALKAFIELRDVNYPGSTYTLTYEPETDQLKGIYFQALQQQNFEVIFVRMK